MGNTTTSEQTHQFDIAYDEFIESHKNLPILNIENKQGITDYIDFIKPEECLHPIMRGQDMYKRPFITVMGVLLIKNELKPFFQIFFQRYSTGKTWMGCGNYGENLIDTSKGMNMDQLNLIKTLIFKRSANIKDTLKETLNYKFTKEDIEKIIIEKTPIPDFEDVNIQKTNDLLEKSINDTKIEDIIT